MSGVHPVKTCTKCLEEKPLAEFHRQTTGPMGRHSWCKPCANAYQRERRVKTFSPEQKARWNRFAKYGLTEDQYRLMLLTHQGQCAICRKPTERLLVDHCHKTGAVRGLLCHRCNLWLAAIEDQEFLERALQYLSMEKSESA